MERGVVDGVVYALYAMNTYKLWEICKYVAEGIGFGITHVPLVINQKTWAGLPPDVKAAIEDINLSTAAEVVRGLTENDEKGRKVMIEAGVEFYTLPSAERDRWTKAVAPTYESWIKSMEERGLPGREYLDDLASTVEKHGLKPPF